MLEDNPKKQVYKNALQWRIFLWNETSKMKAQQQKKRIYHCHTWVPTKRKASAFSRPAMLVFKMKLDRRSA